MAHFIGPGDLIRGKDGRDWLVIATFPDHSLTLWNAERGTWTGLPKSSTFDIILLAEERYTETILAQAGLKATRIDRELYAPRTTPLPPQRRKFT